jgi:hypothetical protein
LRQWICEPEIPLQAANPKKSTVKKIEFSNFGDKFVALNLDGSLFIFSFGQNTNNTPFFCKKGLKVLDFGFVDDEGTTVALISKETKSVLIFDFMTGSTLS